MSRQAVVSFWRAVEAVPQLEARIRTLSPEAERTRDEIVKIAAAEGFVFTRAELEGVGVATAFLMKAQHDTRLREQFDGVGQLETPDLQRQAVIQMGRDAGFPFADEDLMAVTGGTATDGRMSDDDLENIAGGNATGNLGDGLELGATFV